MTETFSSVRGNLEGSSDMPVHSEDSQECWHFITLDFQLVLFFIS